MKQSAPEFQSFSDEIPLKNIIKQWDNWLVSKEEKDYLTVFIDIPFCESRCTYCLYKSDVLKNESEIDLHLDDIEKQMKSFSPVSSKVKVKSLYIGGGTPSILTLKQLKRLFNIINENLVLDFEEHNMFSFESNPVSLTTEKIDYLINETFINRISMGVQTLSNQILIKENRPFLEIDDLSDRIKYIKQSFDNSGKGYNFNIDLIGCWENQELELFFNDIYFLANLNVPKITLYTRQYNFRRDDTAIEYLESNFDLFMKHGIEFALTVGYTKESNPSNITFFNMMHEDNDCSYDNIYMDKILNFGDKKNSCMAFGRYSASWVDTDLFYIYNNNKYYQNNLFNSMKEQIEYNMKHYIFDKERTFYHS